MLPNGTKVKLKRDWMYLVKDNPEKYNAVIDTNGCILSIYGIRFETFCNDYFLEPKVIDEFIPVNNYNPIECYSIGYYYIPCDLVEEV